VRTEMPSNNKEKKRYNNEDSSTISLQTILKASYLLSIKN
jgi:hypothetical protein